MEWDSSYRQIQGLLGSSSIEYVVKDKLIDEARNEIVEKALSQDCSHVFMLGDDVIPQHNVLKRLWARDKDIVTGVYWTKEYPSQPYMWKDMNGPYTDWLAGEFFQIWGAGCDCLLVKTEVFKKMKEPWFSLDYQLTEEDNMPKNIDGEDITLSHTDVRAMTTEDFYFYDKARHAGFDLWVDTSVQCLHQCRHSGVMFGMTTTMPQYSKEQSELMDKLSKNKKKKKVADLRTFGQADISRANFDTIRFDSREEMKPDYRTDFSVLPYHGEVDKFDEVNVEHLLEYYSADKSITLLREWMGICRKGGKFTITIPNVYEHINGKIDSCIWDYKSGWDEKDIIKLLKKTGMISRLKKDIKIRPSSQNKTISVECKVLKNNPISNLGSISNE